MNPDRWPEVSRIFQAALEHDDPRALARALCADTPDILREVEALLAAHERAEHFLESPPDALADASSSVPALAPGSKLGPFVVTTKIGEGGAGEVYRAHDPILNRDVALKVLPSAFVGNDQRLARLEQEARVLASLDQEHIGRIYGFEKTDDAQALVLELISGPTLADRIADRPLPWDDAMEIARQIGEALDVAHDAGVVHRDLKPANIKLRPDDTVKVLDFGLARLTWDADNDADRQATVTTGVISTSDRVQGTAPYMSPEQLRGKAVDRRTDVWAFGCILFEMLTGECVFARDSFPETVTAVLTADVPYEQLPRDTPDAVRNLLRRCLERDPDRRLRSVLYGLVQFDEEYDSRAVDEARPGRLIRDLAWGAAAGASVLLGAGLFRSVAMDSASMDRGDATSIIVHESAPLHRDSRNVVTLSPDGQHLVYVAFENDSIRLYHRPANQLDAVRLTGTEGARDPAFSPDGRWVAFIAGTALKRTSLDGDPVATIADLPGDLPLGTSSFSWADDDTIWIGSPTSGLYTVPAAGGTPRRVTAPGDGTGHGYPHALPGSRAVLYEERRQGSRFINVYDPVTGEHRPLVHGWRPSYATSGHLLFFDHETERAGDIGALWVAPFDPGLLRLTGEPARVLDGIHLTREGVAQAYVGGDGTLAYVPGPLPDERTLVWVDRNGLEAPVGAPPRRYRSPRVSPDGTRILVLIEQGPAADLHVYDIERDLFARVTSDPALDDSPVWSPDGDRVAFHSRRDDPKAGGVYEKAADGRGSARLLYTDPSRRVAPTSWHTDGVELLMNERTFTGPGIFTGRLTLTRDPVSQPLIPDGGQNWASEFSPDGQWVAYNARRNASIHIAVRRASDTGPGVPVSSRFGWHATWSSDSRELFYRERHRSSGVYAARIRRGDGEPSIAPERLFDDTYFFRQIGPRDYDVGPDGRFLMIKERVAGVPGRQINIVRQWTETLKDQVPTR